MRFDFSDSTVVPHHLYILSILSPYKKRHIATKKSEAAPMMQPLKYLNDIIYLSSTAVPAFCANDASIAAIVARLTMSRTDDSTEIKWIGLFKPI